MSTTKDISVEKFIDYLAPIVGELGTEIVQMESPSCKDREGYGYLAKSRFIFYKYGTEIEEQEAIEAMANEMKKEVEVRWMRKNHDEPNINVERLGIYTIHIQFDGCKDDELEKYHRTKETQHRILIWIRYGFGKKDMFDNNVITDT